MVLNVAHRHSSGIQADDHRIQPVQTTLAHGATRARREGPGPVPRHHRSRRAPPRSPPSWAWSRSWRCCAPGRSARPFHSPGARSSQAARPLSRASLTRAGSRPSAPVIFTWPTPGLLEQAVQSPLRTQPVNRIMPSRNLLCVVISSSHQCQSFQRRGLHKPLNTLLFADDRHAAVQASWSVYQRLIQAYRTEGRRAWEST